MITGTKIIPSKDTFKGVLTKDDIIEDMRQSELKEIQKAGSFEEYSILDYNYKSKQERSSK